MFKIILVCLMMTGAFAANLRPVFSERFEQWLDEFRVEIRDHEHKLHVFRNWIENDKVIETTNSRNLTYTLGHNHFSGMDSNEFSQYMGFEYNSKQLFGRVNSGKIEEVKCLTGCVECIENRECVLFLLHVYDGDGYSMQKESRKHQILENCSNNFIKIRFL